MHVALYQEVETKLEPALKLLRNTLKEKEDKFDSIIKIGRTFTRCNADQTRTRD